MNKPILITGLILVAVLASLSVYAATFRAEAQIPAAAAAEANLVCTTFSGLQNFVVTPLPPASAPEGQLQRYRVTATCKSQHLITGVIELAEASGVR